MKGAIAALFAVTLVASAGDSHCLKDEYGNVVCGRGECAADQYKKIFCAPPGGAAIKDKYGTVVCGVGACAKDYLDRVWCSRDPGGGAAIDDHKRVKCAGGCELATAERCEAAK